MNKLEIIEEEVLKEMRERVGWKFKLNVYQKIGVIKYGLREALNYTVRDENGGETREDKKGRKYHLGFAFGMWDAYFRNCSGLPGVLTLAQHKSLTRRVLHLFNETFNLKELKKIWERIEKGSLEELKEIEEKVIPEWEGKLKRFSREARKLLKGVRNYES